MNFQILQKHPFKSGGLEVNPMQNRVIFKGKETLIQPKVMELLIRLVSVEGETLSKSQLTEILWPGIQVGPDSLANTMTRLRRALDDNARNPVFIETVQKKGYRWCQPVALIIVENNRSKTTALAAIGLISLLVIAVIIHQRTQETPELPFENMTIEKKNGGLEVEVSVKGEITPEKIKQISESLKGITGKDIDAMDVIIEKPEEQCDKNNKECEEDSLDRHR